jgi:hypothetical protein
MPIPEITHVPLHYKQNSTAEGWSLGAQILCVEAELPPYVNEKNPHKHTFSFVPAAQNNLAI